MRSSRVCSVGITLYIILHFLIDVRDISRATGFHAVRFGYSFLLIAPSPHIIIHTHTHTHIRLYYTET